MTIKFITQSKKNPATIFIRLREGRDIDLKVATNFKVDLSNFKNNEIVLSRIPSKSDAETKRKVLAHNEQLMELQQKLANLKVRVLNSFNNKEDYQLIDAKWLKSIICPSVNFEIPNSVVDYFDYYISLKKDAIKESTKKKMNVIKNRLKAFEKVNGAVYIQDVDSKFSTKFQLWCNEKNFSNNTKKQSLKEIKTICRHARENGVPTSPQLDSLGKDLKYKRANHIHLTLDDLRSVSEVTIEDEKLDAARDWLLISCYTAQRVSDLLMFSKKDIVYIEGMKFLPITQKKTSKPVPIYLMDNVITILDKRGGEFPPIFSKSNASNIAIYNKLIKEVCRVAGLRELVTVYKKNTKTNRYEYVEIPKYKAVSTHIGRRSFATNYYNKIDTPLLISMTGHSTERQFLDYVGKSATTNAVSFAKALLALNDKQENQAHFKVIRNASE